MSHAGSSPALGATGPGALSSSTLSGGAVAGLVVALLFVTILCLVLVLRCFGLCYCCGERRRTCVGGTGEAGEKAGWA